MLNLNKKGLFLALFTAFLCGLCISIATEQWWALGIPFVALLGYMSFVKIEWVYMMLVFATPLSFLYNDPKTGATVAIPTEPILFGLLIVLLLNFAITKSKDVFFWKNPIIIAITLFFTWQAFTIINSTMPLVSIKFFIANMWMVIVFLGLAYQTLSSPIKQVAFWWLYIIPLIGVVVYSLLNHAQFNFSLDVSSDVMYPFFIDHGIYGATLAFVLPFIVIFSVGISVFSKRPLVGFIAALALILLSIGLIFSFTRAAWISVGAATVFYILLRFKVQFTWLLSLLIVAIGLFLTFQTEINLALNRNKTVSSKDLDKHLKSISNIKNDASNLERLNRWSSGFRMFAQKPLMGWGPGTYQFQYAPFQKPYEKTIISTNMHEVGGIHSEYFGPLVEMGILGMLLFFAMVSVIIQQGMRVYYILPPGVSKLLVLSSLLGLITYFTHGVLNNYFDSDKCACLVWGATAIILHYSVAINKLQKGYSQLPASTPSSTLPSGS